MIEDTLTLNEHEVDPQGLDAEQVTVVVPEGNEDPEGGMQVTVPAGVPLVAVGSVQVAMFVLQRSMSAGQALICGVSLIVTLNAQKLLPHELVAVHVTVDVPVGNVDPEAGTQVTVAAGVPEAGGVGKNTTWLSHCV